MRYTIWMLCTLGMACGEPGQLERSEGESYDALGAINARCKVLPERPELGTTMEVQVSRLPARRSVRVRVRDSAGTRTRDGRSDELGKYRVAMAARTLGRGSVKVTVLQKSGGETRAATCRFEVVSTAIEPKADAAPPGEDAAALPDVASSDAMAALDAGSPEASLLVDGSTTPPDKGMGTLDDVFPGTNIRFFPCIGVRPGGLGFEGGADWLMEIWDKRLAPRADDWRGKSPKTYLCVLKKLRWRDVYVDPQRVPVSSVQARDPNWSNYKWNQNDAIRDALNADPIVAGKAKLGLLIADQSTAAKDSQPPWFTSLGFTYAGRTRLDIPQARQHVADFYVALIKRYGLDARIYGIVMGEYFRGAASVLPGDFDNAAYHQGRRFIWEEMNKFAPRDPLGRRVAIYQTHPLFAGGVTQDDLVRFGIGISSSDIDLFNRGCGRSDADPLCDPGTRPRLLQDAFAQRLVPTMMNGDDRMARQGVAFTWTGVENPWGWPARESHVATPQELAWYHGSGGIVPLHSIFLNITEQATFTSANWFEAFDRFGPNGAQAPTWGYCPAPSP